MGSLKLPNMIDITACVDRWSTDPPTEDGWYWAYDREDSFLDLVRYSDSGATMWSDKTIAKLFTHWLGPLPKPEPPRNDIANTESIQREIAGFEATHDITSEEFLSMRAKGKTGHIPHANVWASLCGILLLSYRAEKPESRHD